MAIGTHHTRLESATDDWITPQYIIAGLGPFDLDPCASCSQPWPTAAHQFTVHDDGRMRTWNGFVFMNPPYGKAIDLWLGLLAKHGDGIALMFARTETRAFFRHVWPVASAIFFVKGRINFHYPDGSCPRNGGNSGGPSCLIGYGAKARLRIRESGLRGKFIDLWSTTPATARE